MSKVSLLLYNFVVIIRPVSFSVLNITSLTHSDKDQLVYGKNPYTNLFSPAEATFSGTY